MSTRSACDRLLAALCAAALASACSAAPPAPQAEPGAPLPGLGADELARFRAGEAVFGRVFTPEGGLGPLFNENQCSACHTFPASGGTGEQRVVRAVRIDASGACDLLSGAGGENVRRQATPALRAHGVERQDAPAGATAVGRFSVPFLYGLGLVEAIPEDAILAREDPDDADGDGVSGRAARDATGRVARFGRKAEHATILSFVDNAIRQEMGLTTPLRPDERDAGGAGLPPGADLAADPEVDRATLERLVDYVRFLAPPARRIPADPKARRMAERGEELFHRIGCPACHTPFMDTGPDAPPALARRRVHLYSDLLLHDLGPGLADACGRDASPAELRTAPLMGLGHRREYLHDGRALTLPDAIRAHAGEATRARARFDALERIEQEALLRFLETL